MFTKYLTYAVSVLWLCSNAVYADVQIHQGIKVIVSFTDNEAQVFANALGVHESLSKELIEHIGNRINLFASVRGHVQAGQPAYHWDGRLELSLPEGTSHTSTQYQLTGVESAKLYQLLSGLSPREVNQDGTKIFLKRISMENITILVRYAPASITQKYSGNIMWSQ